jgi:hypothetical protein
MDEWSQRIRTSSIRGAKDEVEKIASALAADESLAAGQLATVRRILAVARHASTRI